MAAGLPQLNKKTAFSVAAAVAALKMVILMLALEMQTANSEQEEKRQQQQTHCAVSRAPQTPYPLWSLL